MGPTPLVWGAQGNSGIGELTGAMIAGSTGMHYVGDGSSAGKRTVTWTRHDYIGAVNVYYARNSGATAGYCTTPNPAVQGLWTIANGVGIVTSDYEITALTITGIPDGDDYCLLVRSASASEPWAVTNLFEIDNTEPTISLRETQDLDANGKIDAIKVTLNEEILDSTITIANFATSHAELIDTDYTGTIGGIDFTNGIATVTANDAVFYLKLNEHAASDTETLPTITYTKGTLTDLADNFLATTGAIASTDKAAPAVVITDSDANTVNIAEATVTFTFTFSEDVTGFDATDVDTVNGAEGVWTPVSAKVYTLVVTPTAGFTGNVTVDVPAGGAIDGNANTNTIALTDTQPVDMLAPTLPTTNIVGTTFTGAGDTIVITFDGPVVTHDGGAWAVEEFDSISGSLSGALTLTNAGFVYAGNALTITLDEATNHEYLTNGDVITV
ncbi:MAG: Ig-like domain-containing protein, partial [Candidatus Parcubacteria bacterium]|nr:Ig-like domain-containing protein [Candidatus Parcubacteria bacterium]